MTKVKVDKDIKLALDGLIYKDDAMISERTKKKRIEEIIRHYARYSHWNGYVQLNRLTLLELTEILTKGYESIPTEEEKLIEKYNSHYKIVEFYKANNSMDKNEIRQERFSRGYISAFEDLLNDKIDISKVKITQ